VTSLRVADAAERAGLDVTEHGEQAYTSGEGAVLLLPLSRTGDVTARPGPVVEKVGGSA